MNLKRIIREGIKDFEWTDEITPDPIQYYFDNGYKSVGILTYNNEEIKELLKNLYSLGYKWYSKEPKHLYIGDGKLIIWVSKFGNRTNIQFSDSDYFGEEDKEDGDIIIDNPFINLNESKENPFKWIEDIEPTMSGWDLYNSEPYGQTFNIKLKDNLLGGECVYEYFPPDIEFDSVTARVELVSISGNVNLVDENCDNSSGDALLLKFYETNDGHAGDHHEFTLEKNEINYDICYWKCWWVKPQVIEIVP